MNETCKNDLFKINKNIYLKWIYKYENGYNDNICRI